MEVKKIGSWEDGEKTENKKLRGWEVRKQEIKHFRELEVKRYAFDAFSLCSYLPNFIAS